MNRDEIVKSIKKKMGVWSSMDSAERELVIMTAMMVAILSGLLLWIVF